MTQHKSYHEEDWSDDAGDMWEAETVNEHAEDHNSDLLRVEDDGTDIGGLGRDVALNFLNAESITDTADGIDVDVGGGGLTTVADDTVTLSDGSAIISTGVTTTPTRFGIFLDPSGDGANTENVKASARTFWEYADGASIDEDFSSGDFSAYSGSTGAWSIDSTFADSGSNSATVSADFNKIYRDDITYGQGDTITFHTATSAVGTTNTHSGWFVFGLQNSGDHYEVRLLWDTGEVQLYSRSGGSQSFISSSNIGLDTENPDEWYEVQIDWGTDDSITVEVFDSNGNSVGTHSDTDTTYTTAGGFGFNADVDDANSEQVWFDTVGTIEAGAGSEYKVEILEDGTSVGNPDVGYEVVEY